VTEFKKYKNRKIYNKNTSKYATLSEVYYASLGGPVSVTDATTGGDITDDTVIRGALEIFSGQTLKVLADEAIAIGRKYSVQPEERKLELTETAQRAMSLGSFPQELKTKLAGRGIDVSKETPFTPSELETVKEEVQDLFSGKGAQ